MSNDSLNIILTPTNSKNFRKLSLSQRKRKAKVCDSSAQTQTSTKNNLSQVLNWNSCLPKPFAASLENSDGMGENNSSTSSSLARQLRVKPLEQLQEPAPESKEIYKETIEENTISENIINISSDEESDFKVYSRTRRRSKKPAKSKKKPVRKTPLLKDEKIVVVRKLTNNTNLKTFSSKNMPASQRSISDYFKFTRSTTKVGYFETFENSCFENRSNNNGLIETKSEPEQSKSLSAQLFQSSSKISDENSNSSKMPRKQTIYKNIPTSSIEIEPRTSQSIFNESTHRSSASERLKIARVREFVNDSILLNRSQTPTAPSKTKIRKRLPVASHQENEKLPSECTDKLKVELVDLTATTFSKNTTVFKDSSLMDLNVSKRPPQRKCTVAKSNMKTTKRKKIECPSYKIIENTTFAVDAFRFGEIEGVTHYFLTHFHADHYIGLTKKFSKPIYLSAITAKLVTTFIRTSTQFLHIVDEDAPITVNGIEVIALDANHCPGALMFLFKFPNGLCTLHTGDFRASPDMEVGPFLWNNPVNTLYLDTTYLSSKYAFKPQCDTISDVICAIDDFQEKHIGEKILYIFGSYTIGKEKIWAAIAEAYKLHVWTEGPRRKALDAIGNQDLLKYLVDNPRNAQMHILALGNISYDYLVKYMDRYSDDFDVLFAIRASGWQTNSKPQYGRKINIIGVEYSEHSSYEELRRFVYYIQPSKIISTVPIGSCVSKTSKIPGSWLNSKVRSRRKGYQTSISNFINIKDSRKNLPRSTSRIINEIDDAKCIDSSDDLEMLDATCPKEAIACESVSDWML